MHEHRSAARLAIGRDEMRIGLKSRFEAFRVVEPVDPDHQGPVPHALAQAPHVPAAVGGLGLSRNSRDVDADREDLRAHDASEGAQNAIPQFLSTGPAQQIISEAVQIRLGLKADQIVRAQ